MYSENSNLIYELRKDDIYNSFFHENSCIMLLIEPQTGNIIDSNYNACKFYGYPEHIMNKKNINDLLVSDNQYINKNKIHCKHKTALGEEKELDININCFEFKKNKYSYYVIRECFIAKEQSTSNADITNLLFKSNLNPAIILKGRHIYDCNQAFLDALKIKSKKGALNRRPSELSPEYQPNGKTSNEYAVEMLNIVKEKGINNFEWVHKCTNGELLPTLVSLYSIEYHGEEMYLAKLLDLTNQKQTELDLLKSKKKAEESNLLKTEFLRNISHEIRTPLNAISGFSELLEGVDDNITKIKQYSKFINDSSKHLLCIFEDILEFSFLTSNQATISNQNFDIELLFKDIKSYYKGKLHKKGLSLKYVIPEKSITINTDRERLAKIFFRLIDNSIKYTDEGFIEIGYSVIDKKVQFYIKDTGYGISEEKQIEIFESFSQAKKEIGKKIGGLGLGLTLVRENVKLIGGDISLKSKLDEGTIFYISIPYIKKREDNFKEITPKKNVKYKVLIVEDEDRNFYYLKSLINFINPDIRIQYAHNGQTAINMVETENFDLVLMDLKMPVLNGFETTKKIKQMLPDLKVVAQSAYTNDEDKIRAKNAGCIDFISKPIGIERMKRILSQHLYS